MSDTENERSLHERNLLHLHCDDDTIISIDHLYVAGEETCDDCGKPHRDAGMVGLMLMEEDDCVSAVLSPGDALILANRLQRAASVILEEDEDPPDLDRELTRYVVSDEHPG